MIGVSGFGENLEIVPDGEFLPPMKARCSEEIVQRACTKMGIRMIPAPKRFSPSPTINVQPATIVDVVCGDAMLERILACPYRCFRRR